MDFEERLKQASTQELAAVGITSANGSLMFKGDATKLANDAALIGEASVGIPAYLARYVDPRAVKALFSPMRGEQTFGMEQYGDWTTKIYEGRFEEATGNYAAYGDFNNSGTTGSNENWFYRDSFLAQTNIQFGDRDVESYALANIDRVGNLKYAGQLTLDKMCNASLYYGVDGLKNYGLFTDPNLNANITPETKAATGTSWDKATNIEIYNDFLKLFSTAQDRNNGLVENSDSMKVTLSPTRYTRLLATDAYVGSKSALELIAGAFPNMTFIQAPEMNTDAGEQITIVFDEIQGQPVCAGARNSRLRYHRLVTLTSHYEQKISAGTFGLITRLPVGIVSMLGI